MDDAQLEQLAQMLRAPFPFVEHTGFHVLDLQPGSCHARMPLAPNVNHIGTMYAGALFTLAEVPGGAVSLATFDPQAFYPIVKDVRIRFTALATTDVDVRVELPQSDIDRVLEEVDRHGKADYAWECELTDAHGTVVARTENLYQLRAHPKDAS